MSLIILSIFGINYMYILSCPVLYSLLYHVVLFEHTTLCCFSLPLVHPPPKVAPLPRTWWTARPVKMSHNLWPTHSLSHRASSRWLHPPSPSLRLSCHRYNYRPYMSMSTCACTHSIISAVPYIQSSIQLYMHQEYCMYMQMEIDCKNLH